MVLPRVAFDEVAKPLLVGRDAQGRATPDEQARVELTRVVGQGVDERAGPVVFGFECEDRREGVGTRREGLVRVQGEGVESVAHLGGVARPLW